jgi:thioredoxin 1
MANVTDITDAEFESRVLRSAAPVVVDFWAEWCGPCKMVSPVVEQLAGEFSGRANVYKMDVEANPMVPGRLGIMSLPTVVIFKDGRPVERAVGYRPNIKADLSQKLTALL